MSFAPFEFRLGFPLTVDLGTESIQAGDMATDRVARRWSSHAFSKAYGRTALKLIWEQAELNGDKEFCLGDFCHGATSTSK